VKSRGGGAGRRGDEHPGQLSVGRRSRTVLSAHGAPLAGRRHSTISPAELPPRCVAFPAGQARMISC
jgi:hypothetical protein